MCGIFGLVANKHSRFTQLTFESTLNGLFALAESRGKEAAGLAFVGADSIQVYKQPLRASEMIRQKGYKQIFSRLGQEAGAAQSGRSLAAIGHSRLVTNGTQEEHGNNQPVLTSGLIGIHNGIVVNDEALWKRYPEMPRHYQVDTEVILSLLSLFHKQKGMPLVQAVRRTFQEIEGAASIAVLFEEFNNLLLATNNGSLYMLRDKAQNMLVFASELFILKMLAKKRSFRPLVDDYTIKHVRPGDGYLVNLGDLACTYFALNGEAVYQADVAPLDSLRAAVDVVIPRKETRNGHPQHNGWGIAPSCPEPGNGFAPNVIVPMDFTSHFDRCVQGVARLRRCRTCVLPETMPFITFDEQGVCNYCRGYRKVEPKGADALHDLLDPLRSRDGEPDILVGLSGGRDSTYCLHYLKTEMNMNPISYTYDWGMITDLARRNISRICGKLGIENILVSADINWKRLNIRKNVLAWLKKPDLGMVPLFMAGDKQYFYYATKLKKQNDLKLIVISDNIFERTNFKSGFCGVPPAYINPEHVNTLSTTNTVRLAFYYIRQYGTNPAYLNSSLLDSLAAFGAYYIVPPTFISLYAYIPWDEQTLTDTIVDEYDWEVAGDTKNTWRIGDGTAGFYNYIYFLMAGFTENDTFRSQQIREGIISREEALRRVEEENIPRYEVIKWYCDTIGVDFEPTLRRINEMPKLYAF